MVGSLSPIVHNYFPQPNAYSYILIYNLKYILGTSICLIFCFSLFGHIFTPEYIR